MQSRQFRTSSRLTAHFCYIAVPAILLIASVGYCQQESLSPGVNKSYSNPDVERTAKSYERENRPVVEQRDAILKVCELKPGMTVADIGAGTGLYTRPFARQVGSGGKVYAVDITPSFVQYIEKTCKTQGLNNVIGIVNTDTSAKLPLRSVDLAFICDTYHHFEYPMRMLTSLHQAMRPGGRVVVVDYKKEEGVSPKWIFNHVRADRKLVIEEFARAGFKLIDAYDFVPQHYVLRFEKAK